MAGDARTKYFLEEEAKPAIRTVLPAMKNLIEDNLEAIADLQKNMAHLQKQILKIEGELPPKKTKK
jgi:predicted  nucleic acid-binding Zn-ribbon protein